MMIKTKTHKNGKHCDVQAQSEYIAKLESRLIDAADEIIRLKRKLSRLEANNG